MPTLLAVDDEPADLELFRQSFGKQGLTVLTATSAAEALRLLSAQRPDVAIFDVFLPDQNGIELLEAVRQRDPHLPVIFVTAGGASASAIDAMRHGAFDYLLKPLNLKQVRELVHRALEVRRLMHSPVKVAHGQSPAPATAEFNDGEHLVGRSQAMQNVYKAIGRVAPKNVNVLVRGESGTGKELVARAVYQYSDRRDRPFLAVNCAAIPESLLESELFGHEKGAFTGADRRRIGKFEQCNHGTIFLDEIGDMPIAVQSKMLRLLQGQEFQRVGSNETIRTDVRIIAATHRDLEQMAQDGQFRWDLYYRLNVYSIELPALRDRPDDLPELVHYFLRRANYELDKQILDVEPAAMRMLESYDWPGNIRELQSVVKQSVLCGSGSVLLRHFLPEIVRKTSAPASTPEPIAPPPTLSDVWHRFVSSRLQDGSDDIYHEAVEITEREVISRVLRHTKGNQVQATRLLGITRSTLRSKIAQLGISIETVVESDSADTS